ncbi:MAG: ankyrin repeat domain-containing protein [Candidatus Ozemobacteraceae bacterium]
MSIEKNSCPRRESLLQRLLADDSPGMLTPADHVHLRECAACARTVRAAQKMDGLLAGHFGQIKASLKPVPPSTALQNEMKPTSLFIPKIPLLILGGIIILGLVVVTQLRSLAPPQPSQVIPAPAVPPSKPAPQFIVVSGQLLLASGESLPVGKPTPQMGQMLRCPTEALVRLDADVLLRLEKSESSLNLEKIDLASGKVEVEVSRKGRPFQVVTPAATVSVIGTKFMVALEKNGQTTIAVSKGVVRVETVAGVKQIMNPGNKLEIDPRGKIILAPIVIPVASSIAPVISATVPDFPTVQASETVPTTTEPAIAAAIEPSEPSAPVRNWQFLIDASARGQLETVKRALTNGATVNCQDEEGNTPLHQAARNDQKMVVELLLKSGADKQIKNKWNETPLDLAVKQKATASERLLK